MDKNFKISYYISTSYDKIENDKIKEKIKNIISKIENKFSVKIVEEFKKQKFTQEDFIRISKNIFEEKIGVQLELYISSKELDEIEISKAVDVLTSKISKIPEFKDKIELLRNECSNYLSIKLYKLIQEIEIDLRCIFKKFLITSFGLMWKNKILNKNSRKKNEELESLTLDELYFLLFELKWFKIKYNEKDLNNKTKDELITIIKDDTLLTFWEAYFSDLDSIQENIKKIKTIRNRIMHFKEIKYSQYEQCLKLWGKSKLVIDKAEEKIDLDTELNILLNSAFVKPLLTNFWGNIGDLYNSNLCSLLKTFNILSDSSILNRNINVLTNLELSPLLKDSKNLLNLNLIANPKKDK